MIGIIHILKSRFPRVGLSGESPLVDSVSDGFDEGSDVVPEDVSDPVSDVGVSVVLIG